MKNRVSPRASSRGWPPSTVARLVSRWGPPAVWLGLIFWLSTDRFSAEHTGSVLEPLLRWLFPAIRSSHLALAHHLLRKGAHLTVYAVLATLVFRALGGWSPSRRPVGRALAALALVGACALADEWHQSFTLHRTGSVQDSLIDLTGGTLALLLLHAAGAQRGSPQRSGGRKKG